MINASAAEVTSDVLAVMQRTTDPRLREILVSLVTHLHAFVREVGLTEAELRTAAALINELGQTSSDNHNETVLMAGSLGLSSLVCLLNNGKGESRQTSQSLLGPFWRMHSPRVENGGTIVRSPTPGVPLQVTGRVVDAKGAPIGGAEVDIWHASPAGLYENQDAQQADMNLRGRFTTESDGRFSFHTVKMIGYPIPTNGVVGRLLRAQGRHPFRPAHLHALIVKEGYKVLISQVYDPDDPHIDTDVQFGVTRALMGDFVRHEADAFAERDGAGTWYSLDHTYVMERGETILPRAPIK
ncbi:MAG: catechol 1,2-dioxygenase [Pseudomonadota bacterium]|nr:catechol 1,2-dioxygenase [Pseudomonadota bacterium]